MNLSLMIAEKMSLLIYNIWGGYPYLDDRADLVVFLLG